MDHVPEGAPIARCRHEVCVSTRRPKSGTDECFARVVTWDRVEIGVGKKIEVRMDKAKDKLLSQEVARLGEKIVQQELAAGKADITVPATVSTSKS